MAAEPRRYSPRSGSDRGGQPTGQSCVFRSCAHSVKRVGRLILFQHGFAYPIGYGSVAFSWQYVVWFAAYRDIVLLFRSRL
jgi:hypothetical protein